MNWAIFRRTITPTLSLIALVRQLGDCNGHRGMLHLYGKALLTVAMALDLQAIKCCLYRAPANAHVVDCNTNSLKYPTLTIRDIVSMSGLQDLNFFLKVA